MRRQPGDPTLLVPCPTCKSEVGVACYMGSVALLIPHPDRRKLLYQTKRKPRT